MDEMFSNGYQQRKRREQLKQRREEELFKETNSARKRAQERINELRKKQNSDLENKRQHLKDLENLKKMRINHNIMESASRIAGYTRSDFIKVRYQIF